MRQVSRSLSTNNEATLHSILANLKDQDLLELVHRCLRESGDFKEFTEVLAEELDSILAYDEAISSPEAPIPFEQAIAEIKQGRW